MGVLDNTAKRNPAIPLRISKLLVLHSCQDNVISDLASLDRDHLGTHGEDSLSEPLLLGNYFGQVLILTIRTCHLHDLSSLRVKGFSLSLE